MEEPSKWFHSMVEEYINDMSRRVNTMPKNGNGFDYREIGIHASIARVKQIAAIVRETQENCQLYPSNSDFAEHLEKKIAEVRHQSIMKKVTSEGELIGHEVIVEIMNMINKALGVETKFPDNSPESDEELIPFILK